MQRVVAVDVLNLLAADGLYAQLVQELLDASEVWSAYKDRRHDLYLPAATNPQVLAHTSSLSFTPTCLQKWMHSDRRRPVVAACTLQHASCVLQSATAMQPRD